MKQKLFIFIFVLLVAGLLVGLNAVAFVKREKTPDEEAKPNRSTFNAGATGQQAFFSLLVESGRKAVRWREAPSGLLTENKEPPAVFVMTGALRKTLDDKEVADLLKWVGGGGRLVLIDRFPDERLAVTSANWKFGFSGSVSASMYSADPSDQIAMVGNEPAARPVQPSRYTAKVNAVQPSQFASSISVKRIAGTGSSFQGDEDAGPRDRVGTRSKSVLPSVDAPEPRGPLIHLGAAKALLASAPYGNGEIVILSDPFIVSNGGIGLADNVQLALDLVDNAGGPIAFDEFHLGFGNDTNRFLQFFEGTPVIAIFIQCIFLVGVVFYSRSRRFARPVPAAEPDRLSKLEYVAAMADLQCRMNAFDLAVENIYSDFRRRCCRFFGLDALSAKTAEIARLLGEKLGEDGDAIARDLFACEEVIRGEPTNKKETLRLISTLRSLEMRAGIGRIGRTGS